mgnify:FL=1
MKLTTETLKRMIREELNNITKEAMLGSVMAGLSPLGMEVAKTASQIMDDPDIERPELESMLKGMFAKELASGELSEDEMMEAIERAYSL